MAHKLDEYLQSERQWKREHRISYAIYMRDKAPKEEKPFWTLVLEANEAFK